MGLCVTLAIVLFHSTGLFEPFELKTLDWRFKVLASPEKASDDIVIVAVDQKSLDYYEEMESLPWPWPRGLYEAVIEFVNRGGAQVVLFDILFTERSGFGYEDDEHFTEAVKNGRNVYMPFFLSQKDRSVDETLKEMLLTERSLEMHDASQIRWWTAQSVVLPLDALIENAQGLGNVMMVPDADGVYRRVPLFFKYENRYFPSLPLAAIQDILGVGQVTVDNSNTLHLGPRSVPLQDDGTMLLKYHGGAATYAYYSIASVIQSYVRLEAGERPIIEPEEFKDKIVFVGLIAPGLFDLKPTPLSSVYPGVEVHATATDNILNGDFLTRLPVFTLFLFIFVFNILCGIGVSSFDTLRVSIPLLCVFLVVPFLCALLFFQGNLWFDFVTPEVGVLVTFALTSVVSYATEGKQRKFIKSAFKYYLSPAVIDKLLKNPESLKLGGEKKEMTVLFSDIAGFTTISEQLDPEQLAQLLNEYLSRMTDVILSYGGTVDKYEGDAIMAFWGAPLPQTDHALRACLAALECRSALEDVCEEFQRKGWPRLQARIGMNTGDMIVGNMGSRERFDYTVIGDEVNLGSRLEGANKEYGTWIMISESTCKCVQDEVEARELDLIRVKGKESPVRVYELLARKGQLPEENVDCVHMFAKGLALYRERKWDKALEIFEEIQDDPPSAVFRSRCVEFLNAPPSEDWDGVYIMRTK
ncbi:MAG: adenylate/guanylate cyclase domain-containing protein [Gemmatimonadota bacterium]|nr:MAG: adenylate/guanylate cyclase domain-containing protein [Gemmatimonadota bacterium]